MPGRTVPIASVGAAANLRSAAQSIRASASAGDLESLKKALTEAASAFDSAQYAIDMLEARLREMGQPNTSNVTRQAAVAVSGDRITGGITVQGVLPAVRGQGLDLTLSGQVGTIAAVDHSTGLYLELDLKGSTIAVSATGVYTVTGATVVMKPTVNSTTAIQLQNAAGTAVVDVDTTNGRVGIGATPGAPLDVLGALRALSAATVTPAAGKGLEIRYASGTDNAEVVSYDRTGAAYKDLALDGSTLLLRVAGAEAARATSVGMGIGTTSPLTGTGLSKGLHVYGTAANTGAVVAETTNDGAYVVVKNGVGANFKGLAGARSTNVWDFFVGQYGVSGAILAFYTDVAGTPTERMRIYSNGYVGIGVTVPTSPLQVPLPVYADNATALAAGLTAGAFYRITATDQVGVVH